MAPSSSFLTLLIVGGIVVISIVIGYIFLAPAKKKEHQREVDEKQEEKQEVIVVERTETTQMPTKESKSVPASSLPNQYQQPPETEAAHSEQEARTKEGKVIEPSTPLVIPRGIPEKYAHLAARDRAFYDGIMKLLSLGLDGDLLYEGMETLWKKYNKKQNLN